MRRIALVGAGGMIGSVGRYLVSGWVHRYFGSPWFPYGTLTVNSIGCLLIGYIMGLTEIRQWFNPDTRVFLVVGILGGFTTFSAFGFETFALARDGDMIRSAMNVGSQVALGLVCVWAGYSLANYV